MDDVRRRAKQVALPDETAISDLDDAESAMADRLDGEQYRDDLYRTFKDEDQREDSEPMIVWSALGTWSMNGGDND